MTPEQFKEGQQLLAMAEHCERLSMVCAVYLADQDKHHTRLLQGQSGTYLNASEMKDGIHEKFERIMRAAVVEFETFLNNEAAEYRESFYEL